MDSTHRVFESGDGEFAITARPGALDEFLTFRMIGIEYRMSREEWVRCQGRIRSSKAAENRKMDGYVRKLKTNPIIESMLLNLKKWQWQLAKISEMPEGNDSWVRDIAHEMNWLIVSWGEYVEFEAPSDRGNHAESDSEGDDH